MRIHQLYFLNEKTLKKVWNSSYFIIGIFWLIKKMEKPGLFSKVLKLIWLYLGDRLGYQEEVFELVAGHSMIKYGSRRWVLNFISLLVWEIHI